ncbi:hypothetical protein GGX14DRAFT_696661 [Mycena pura]|uniref:WW domain-containing protein n=1 Tax=Mycena pura TaxID=153505 RepID=A0AAD6VM22_9AGAR|nr:hypothetical protein GGX14DRAFT_696661 [Mycena pura]
MPRPSPIPSAAVRILRWLGILFSRRLGRFLGSILSRLRLKLSRAESDWGPVLPTSESSTPRSLSSTEGSSSLSSTDYDNSTYTSKISKTVPIPPESFARYKIRGTIPRLKNQYDIPPHTFSLPSDGTEPAGWKFVTQPEGARYFFDPERRIFTDVDLCENENLCNVNRVVELLIGEIRSSGAHRNPHYAALLGELSYSESVIVDLVVDLDPYDPESKKPELETAYYYFINHSERIPFWLHSFEAHKELDVWNEIQGPIEPGLLKHAMESQYWLHCALFPSALSLSENDVQELRDRLVSSIGDMSTSTKSTVWASIDELKTWLTAVEHMQCDSDSLGTSFTFGTYNFLLAGAYLKKMIARIMEQFAQVWRLFPGTACNRDRSVYDSVEPGRSILFRAISPFLFFGPDVYLESMKKAYVDHVVLARIWKPIVDQLNTEWQELILIGTVLLATNVSFLSINSVDTNNDGHHTLVQTMSYLSTVSSTGSIMLSYLLVRQSRTKFLRATAAQMAYSVYIRTSKRFGLEPLAVIFCLPFSLIIWSMLSFFVAIMATSTRMYDIARVTTSIAALIITLLVGWCIWDAWDMDAPYYQPPLQPVTALCNAIRSKWSKLSDRRSTLTVSEMEGIMV